MLITILMLVAGWCLMKKANEPGWKAIVPVYNEYMFHQIAGATKYFWGELISWIVIMVCWFLMIPLSFGRSTASAVVTVLCSLVMLAALGYFIYCLAKFTGMLAKAFGKSSGFAAGLFFLSVIFYPIMAFSSEITYQGPWAGQRKAPQSAGAAGGVPHVDMPTNIISPQRIVTAPIGHVVQLIGRSTPVMGQTHRITSRAVLGRSSAADIQLTDGSVSGRHCQLEWKGDKLFIMDLGSSNGTAVDGFGKIPANVPVELRTGDIIRIGRDNVFEIRM